MAALYDLVLMLDPTAPDERRREILDWVHGTIASGGELVGAHDWGVRRLAYEIDHRSDAAYHIFQFQSEPELLEQLDHGLRITDGVLRFRTIRLKPGAAPPPMPRGEPSRAAEEEQTTVAARAAADAS